MVKIADYIDKDNIVKLARSSQEQQRINELKRKRIPYREFEEKENIPTKYKEMSTPEVEDAATSLERDNRDNPGRGRFNNHPAISEHFNRMIFDPYRSAADKLTGGIDRARKRQEDTQGATTRSRQGQSIVRDVTGGPPPITEEDVSQVSKRLVESGLAPGRPTPADEGDEMREHYEAGTPASEALRNQYRTASPEARDYMEKEVFGGNPPSDFQTIKDEEAAEKRWRESGRAQGKPPPSTDRTTYSSPTGSQYERSYDDRGNYDAWEKTRPDAGRMATGDGVGVPVEHRGNTYTDPETGKRYVRTGSEGVGGWTQQDKPENTELSDPTRDYQQAVKYVQDEGELGSGRIREGGEFTLGGQSYQVGGDTEEARKRNLVELVNRKRQEDEGGTITYGGSGQKGSPAAREAVNRTVEDMSNPMSQGNIARQTQRMNTGARQAQSAADTYFNPMSQGNIARQTQNMNRGANQAEQATRRVFNPMSEQNIAQQTNQELTQRSNAQQAAGRAAQTAFNPYTSDQMKNQMGQQQLMSNMGTGQNNNYLDSGMFNDDLFTSNNQPGSSLFSDIGGPDNFDLSKTII